MIELTLYGKKIIYSALALVPSTSIGEIEILFLAREKFKLTDEEEKALEKNPDTPVSIDIHINHVHVIWRNINRQEIHLPLNERSRKLITTIETLLTQ